MGDFSIYILYIYICLYVCDGHCTYCNVICASNFACALSRSPTTCSIQLVDTYIVPSGMLLHAKEVYSIGRDVMRADDVSLLEKCPHFRGWYVPPSMELGPEDVSLLKRCPHFSGMYGSMELDLKMCPY